MDGATGQMGGGRMGVAFGGKKQPTPAVCFFAHLAIEFGSVRNPEVDFEGGTRPRPPLSQRCF